MSSQLLFNFTIDQSDFFYIGEVNKMSVFKKHLLVSNLFSHVLLIFTLEGRQISNITIDTTADFISAATWTPSGNIMYTTYLERKLGVMSKSGENIFISTIKPLALYLSTSNDIIYVCKGIAGVSSLHLRLTTDKHQSSDEGVSWKLVVNPSDGWSCFLVLAVTIGHVDLIWTSQKLASISRLRVYSIAKNQSGAYVTWTNVNTSIELFRSSLSYDGKENIFLSDYNNKAVHAFSVTGQYQCQLLSSDHITSSPCSLVADKTLQILYVAQITGLVQAFKLIYEE